jgi:hypothetical protein
VADYFAAKMRARQQAPVPVPIPVSVPESDSEAQDAPEGTTPVDGIVAGEENKKRKRKRKRMDTVELAEMHGGRTELHAESKKRRKKRKVE